MERDYLLEIGCEEIPAGFVGPALWFGGQQFAEILKKARFVFDRVDIYGTPRRLTYIIRKLSDRQKAAEETALGPPKSVAFDKEGKPTKAAFGFAKAQGVDVSALKVFSTDRGEYLGVVKEQVARPVAEALPEVVAGWIPNIPFKNRRWVVDVDSPARPLMCRCTAIRCCPFLPGTERRPDDLRGFFPRVIDLSTGSISTGSRGGRVRGHEVRRKILKDKS